MVSTPHLSVSTLRPVASVSTGSKGESLQHARDPRSHPDYAHRARKTFWFALRSSQTWRAELDEQPRPRSSCPFYWTRPRPHAFSEDAASEFQTAAVEPPELPSTGFPTSKGVRRTNRHPQPPWQYLQHLQSLHSSLHFLIPMNGREIVRPA